MVNLVDFRPKWPYSPHIWKFVGFLYDFWAILHDLRPIWAHSPHICKFCTQNSRETPHNPPYMQIHPIFWTFSLRKWHFIWWNCPKFLNILQHLIKNPKHFVKTPPGVGYICVFVRFLHVFVRFCAILCDFCMFLCDFVRFYVQKPPSPPIFGKCTQNLTKLHHFYLFITLTHLVYKEIYPNVLIFLVI